MYLSVRVHTTGFGSYKQLLVLCVLLNLSTQIISVAAIVLAILTDTNNIFSSPEFAFGSDGKTWLHAGAHLFIGTTRRFPCALDYRLSDLAVTKRVTRPEGRQVSY